MARIYKHGELGQIEKLTYRLCYCADGNIMRNSGDGWKLWKRVKAGIDPVAHWELASRKWAERLEQCPCYAEFRKAFHAEVSFSNRVLVLAAMQTLGNDVDGLWSELDDHGMHHDLDDLSELVRLMERAENESRERKAMASAVNV